MIDLHTHTLNSDGELIPTELWRRAQVMGYRFLGMTDHVDASNFEEVFARLQAAAQSLNNGAPPYLIPGLEFTRWRRSPLRDPCSCYRLDKSPCHRQANSL